jgi:hypothetical protein
MRSLKRVGVQSCCKRLGTACPWELSELRVPTFPAYSKVARTHLVYHMLSNEEAPEQQSFGLPRPPRILQDVANCGSKNTDLRNL